MNQSEHSPTFTSVHLHPMDVIVKAVETEGIVELLNRLNKRDLRVFLCSTPTKAFKRLLRECTNSEAKPEGSKRSLRKDLEQRWISVGAKKFLKKHINSPQNLNTLATTLGLSQQVQPPTNPSTNLTDRISLIEGITREITTLGNQIFHQKVPNEDIMSFIEAKQKQQQLDDSLKRNTLSAETLQDRKKEKERRPSSPGVTTQAIPIPRERNSDNISPRSRSGESRKGSSPTTPTISTLNIPVQMSPPTPEKKSKQRKPDSARSKLKSETK